VTNIIDSPACDELSRIEANHKYSICNFQSSIPALPGWAFAGRNYTNGFTALHDRLIESVPAPNIPNRIFWHSPELKKLKKLKFRALKPGIRVDSKIRDV
jgi:hypothetical protein